MRQERFMAPTPPYDIILLSLLLQHLDSITAKRPLPHSPDALVYVPEIHCIHVVAPVAKGSGLQSHAMEMLITHQDITMSQAYPLNPATSNFKP